MTLSARRLATSVVPSVLPPSETMTSCSALLKEALSLMMSSGTFSASLRVAVTTLTVTKRSLRLCADRGLREEAGPPHGGPAGAKAPEAQRALPFSLKGRRCLGLRLRPRRGVRSWAQVEVGM